MHSDFRSLTRLTLGELRQRLDALLLTASCSFTATSCAHKQAHKCVTITVSLLEGFVLRFLSGWKGKWLWMILSPQMK